jgi:hypothetical protein
LADLGVRGEEVSRVLGSMANILDAVNPVRNSTSVAHPNEQLVGEPEAVLVINKVRTMLSYFESKRRQVTVAPTLAWFDSSTKRQTLLLRKDPTERAAPNCSRDRYGSAVLSPDPPCCFR